MNALRGARVALVTYAGLPELSDDDQLLQQELTRRGAVAVPVCWDAEVAWGNFDAILIRSPWDYYKRYAEFLLWLDRIEACGAPVWNPVSVLRWNAEKGYMRALGAAGVPTTPTAWLRRGSVIRALDLMAERGWSEIVVKPTVSATAFETFRVGPDVTPKEEARIAALLLERDLMVQPYLPAIAATGEYSLLFFAGEFSHAVLKRPVAGDFRVQNEFGGTVSAVQVEPLLVAEARAVITAAPGPLLYARVDGCVVDGHLMLMELELVEPSLFFREDPAAAGRMATALESLLARTIPAR